MKFDMGSCACPWNLGIPDNCRAARNTTIQLPPPQHATPAETIELEDRWARESVFYLQSLT
jgi:hypothetical protein